MAFFLLVPAFLGLTLHAPIRDGIAPGRLAASHALLAPRMSAPETAADEPQSPPSAAASAASSSSLQDRERKPESLPPVGETLRFLNPQLVTVADLDLDQPTQLPPIDPTATFVDMFRSTTPYIKMHQGKTMVIHVASEVLERAELFDALMEEVSVLALLGVRPVLLVGVHRQVDEGLRSRGLRPPKFHSGVRETDEPTLRIVQEVPRENLWSR